MLITSIAMGDGNKRKTEMTQVNGQTGRVLPDLTRLSRIELETMMLEMAAKLETSKKITVRFKVTDKGMCSVYHGSRFPTTLYRSQWLRIIAAIPGANGLEAFLSANAAKLPLKNVE